MSSSLIHSSKINQELFCLNYLNLLLTSVVITNCLSFLAWSHCQEPHSGKHHFFLTVMSGSKQDLQSGSNQLMLKIFIFHQSLPILIYSFLKYCFPVNKIISNSFCSSSTFQNSDCASGPLNTVTLWDHGNMPSVVAPTLWNSIPHTPHIRKGSSLLGFWKPLKTWPGSQAWVFHDFCKAPALFYCICCLLGHFSLLGRLSNLIVLTIFFFQFCVSPRVHWRWAINK